MRHIYLNMQRYHVDMQQNAYFWMKILYIVL